MTTPAALLALPLLALATPLNSTSLAGRDRDSTAVVQCTTGNAAMCCNNVNSLDAASGSAATGNFGFLGQALSGQGGIQCVAVGVEGGALSSDCKNANACCGQTGQAGFASFSCTPINIL